MTEEQKFTPAVVEDDELCEVGAMLDILSLIQTSLTVTSKEN